MATLVENAADVATCASNIDATIKNYGGTTSGGLRNVAAALETIPGPSIQWSKRPWRNDGNVHIWFDIEDVPNKYISFSLTVTSFGNITVNWGDGQTSTIKGPISATSRSFNHTYANSGVYEVSISGVDSITYRGQITYCYSLAGRSMRQYEGGCESIMSSTFSKSFQQLFNLCYIKLNHSSSLFSMIFSDTTSLRSVEGIEEAQVIGTSSFQNSAISNLQSLPNCIEISSAAFAFCPYLKTIGDLMHCTSIGNTAFSTCKMLRSIGAMPSCTSIGGSAFANCYNLKTIGDLSNCTTVKQTGFYGCSSLGPILNLPLCTQIETNAFSFTHKLKTLNLGTLTAIASRSFFDIGAELLPDSDGFTSVITVGNTMASLRALSELPWGAPTTTKFVCSDGYIAYEGGAWTDHPAV